MSENKPPALEADGLKLELDGLVKREHTGENGERVIDEFALYSVSMVVPDIPGIAYVKFSDSFDGLRDAVPRPFRGEFKPSFNPKLGRAPQKLSYEPMPIKLRSYGRPLIDMATVALEPKCPTCKEPMRVSIKTQSLYCADPTCEMFNTDVAYEAIRADFERFGIHILLVAL